MGFYRKERGLLFEEGFTEPLLPSNWELSPAQARAYDADKHELSLLHSDGDTLLLFDVPDEPQLVLDVTADYLPTRAGDEGGLIIWQDAANKLEFLECPDSALREYSRWRAVKDGNRWSFYADRGSGWEFSDSAFLPAVKAGLLLRGERGQGFENLILKRATLCRGNGTCTVGNVAGGYTVYLCDPEGHSVTYAVVEEGWSGTAIPLPSIPFRGLLKLYDADGTLLSQSDVLEIYSGDEFLFGTDLEVKWRGQVLPTDKPTHLGTLYDGSVLVQMELWNPASQNHAAAITLGILQYREQFGFEWVEVANDADGRPGEFAQRIDMGELAAETGKPFWIKVDKTGEVFSIKPAMFVLDVNHV